MPIYEYVCAACGHQFERLVLPASDQVGECPECHGQELERALSGFAVGSADRSRANVVAKRRQLAQSKDRTDQRVAEAERVKAHRDEH